MKLDQTFSASGGDKSKELDGESQNSVVVPLPQMYLNPSVNSSFGYDTQNGHYFTAKSVNTEESDGEATIIDGQGQLIKSVQIAQSMYAEDWVNEPATDHMSDESETKKASSTYQYGDNWSILRFLKGNKSKGLEISSSGLTLKITKSKGGKHQSEELVLTNMAFSTGLHLWEIIATICCNNLQIGVYNPVTKVEALTSFKTTTPRMVTVCLDLNENKLKFWLNDRRMTNKNIELPSQGGPWIPCVKIDKEKNKIILNPYAREPSDFYEKDFDKKFHINKYIIPHLHNMVCVTKLPEMSANTKEAAQQLKEHLKIASSHINRILMPQTSEGQAIILTDMFCFIQFHHHDSLSEFIQRNKDNKQLSIYQSHDIAAWFTSSKGFSDEIKGPFSVISAHIQIPRMPLNDALKAIDLAFTQIVKKEEYSGQTAAAADGGASNNSAKLNFTAQPFSDKMIAIKRDQNIVKLIARDISTNTFDVSQANFNEPTMSLLSSILLKVEVKLFHILFKSINWTWLLKDQNDIVNGIAYTFFTSILKSTQVCGTYLAFKVPLITSKLFIEMATQQAKAQLERVRRSLTNYQTVVPHQSIINTKPKAEQILDELTSFEFFTPHDQSTDELNMLLQVLYDIQEQMWAQSRAAKCPFDVKSLLNTVSRPFSALNRLGSYITWGLSNVSSVQMSNNGYFYRESNTVSVFNNPLIEIPELSQELVNIDIQEEVLGRGNRLMNGLVTENIPLHRGINYLSPYKISSSAIIDVISSQNSEFVLIGGSQGNIHICNSAIQLVPLKTVAFFAANVEKRHKKHKDIITKIQSRKEAFDGYKESIARKCVPLSILSDLKDEVNEKYKASTIKAAKPKKSAKKSSVTSTKAQKATATKSQKKDKKLTPITLTTNIDPKQIETTKSTILNLDESIKPEIDASTSVNTVSLSIQNLLVIGYILLSKPVFDNNIDPLLVGCLYYDTASKKYFLKVRKLMFLLHYLQNFITLDTNSGQQINKLSGKQIINTNDFKKLYQEVLNHRDVVVDLYSIFMRTQIIKKEWPRKDNMFSVLTDICEAEVEITNCTNIVDFTKCSYSIDNQDKIYLLIDTIGEIDQAPVRKLVEYTIKDEVLASDQVPKIALIKGKELQFNTQSLRVFQFDNKILVVNQNSYEIISQDSMRLDHKHNFTQSLKVDDLAAIQQINIINESKPEKMFNKQNLNKFNNIALTPQQNWQLVINIKENHKYDLVVDLNQQQIQRQKTEKATQFNLEQCIPSDILQIGNLLQCKRLGTIATQNQHSHLTSACQDSESMLYTNHSWHILQNKVQTPLSFDIKLPKNNKETNIREIQFEFSFKKITNDIFPYDKAIKRTEVSSSIGLTTTNEPHEVNHQLQKLPLQIEFIQGAQINDIIQPCHLTSRDSSVFSSNYAQPEFILRHQNNKQMVISQFVVRSRENKEWHGIPLSQGIIFVADSLEDLMNTKNFSRFTEKEYNDWKKKRNLSSQIPLMSNEPVAFVNLDDKMELVVTLDEPKICRFIKFIPTAFRKKPINFSSKPFNTHQVECQFFGVNGFEAETTNRGVQHEVAGQSQLKELEIELNATLEDPILGQVANISELYISELRNARSPSTMLPYTSLQQLNLQHVTGVAKIAIECKEEYSDCIGNLIIKIPGGSSNKHWQLQSVAVSLKEFNDSQSIFIDPILRVNKPRLRHYLLDPSQFENLLLPLLSLTHNDINQEDVKIASIKCVLSYLKDIENLNISKIIVDLFTQHTDISKFLDDGFLSLSQSYQNLMIQYLNKIDIMQKSKDYIFTFVKNQIKLLTSQARSNTGIQTINQLTQQLTQSQQQEILSSLAEVLFDQICQTELPKYQTKEYIILRSKLNIDAYPFDTVSKSISDANKANNQVMPDNSHSLLLNSSFEVFKINTLYHYNIDLYQKSACDKLILYFNQDSKSLHKICVRVIVPDNNGVEQLILTKTYDENIFTQVCDIAHKEDNTKYFANLRQQALEVSQQDGINLVSLAGLNSLSVDLGGHNSRYLKVQVELLDSYRTVHKPYNCTGIFIRPEIYGQHVYQNDIGSSVELASSFEISKPDESNYLSKLTFNNINYSLYLIPNNQLSQLRKACLFVMEDSQMPQPKPQAKVVTMNSDVIEPEELDTLRQELRCDLTDSYQASASKKKIALKVQEIQQNQKTQSDIISSPNMLTLQYLFQLGDTISKQLVKSIDLGEDQVLLGRDIKTIYMSLFKHFIVYDQKAAHPNILKLLDRLFAKIEDKQEFLYSIIQEFILQNNTPYNKGNVVAFIQSSVPLSFNILMRRFLAHYTIDVQGSDVDLKIDSRQKVEEVIDYLNEVRSSQQIIKENQLDINAMLYLLKIIDSLKVDENNSEPINISLFITLLYSYIIKILTQNVKSEKNKILFQYALNILLKYLQNKNVVLEYINQQELLVILKTCNQMNEKDVDKIIKRVVIEMSKHDEKNSIILIVGSLIHWYQNKENVERSKFYQDLELKETGQGSGQFIKHLSASFKIYIKLVQQSKTKDSLEDAYRQLGEVMTYILGILITDKHQEQYEQDYFDIWLQVYQSLAYLDEKTLNDNQVNLKFVQAFYSLPTIIQQSLYPKFHQRSQKKLKVAQVKTPHHFILKIQAFLLEGFKSNETMKVAYCYCDGMLNLIQSGEIKKSTAATQVCKFPAESIYVLVQVLANYLNLFVYHGIFTGVTGAIISTIMRLDIAIQIVQTLLNAQDTNNDNIFEAFILSDYPKEAIIQSLLDWIFLNYSNLKSKSSPAGTRIFTLSAGLEQILSKVSISDKVVTKCLPILMKTVLKIDNKLRVLVKETSINSERAVQIQKTVNILFLSFFKAWMQSDAVAKRFLNELNGFDFLLDRLFSKTEQREKKLRNRALTAHQGQIDDEVEKMFDQIVRTLKITQPNNEALSLTQPKEKKVIPGGLPPIMKKQTAIKASSKFLDYNQEAFGVTKDLEASLQEEDFARSMKIIWSSDREKSVSTFYENLAWNKFKNGTKNRIYNYLIANNDHLYEYVMIFDLETMIQISEIQIGLLYNWSTYEQDTQYEPLSFIVEGGKTQDQSEWKVLLTAVEDGGYKLNSITVYGHNFTECVNSEQAGSLEEKLEAIGCKECRYLTFRLRKPLMCCLDSSLYIGSTNKVKSYGISYISVMGIASQNKQIYPFILDLQKENSLEVLSKFFSGEFTEAFEIIAEQPEIIEKIKNAFDKLSSLLDSKASLVKPIFLALCAKNEDLSNWIITNRLISLDESSIKNEQIKFLGEIISSNKTQQLSKLAKVKEFLLLQIQQVASGQIILNEDQQILLSRFLKLYILKIREYSAILATQLLANNYNEGLMNSILNVEFSLDDLNNIIAIMNQYNDCSSKLIKALISFALMFLIPPKPFINQVITVEQFVQQLLLSKENQLQNLLFCSIIASTNQQTIQIIINSGKIEEIIKSLQEDEELLNETQILSQINILYNCTKQKVFKNKYRESITFLLYEILKNKDNDSEKLLKESLTSEHVQMFVQTIKELVIGGEEAEDKLSDLLKHDIVIASKKGDVEFINQVVVSILHAEDKIPVSFNIFDKSESNRGIHPVYSNFQTEAPGSAFFLKTDILNEKQKDTLLKSFKEISSDKVDNLPKLLESQWEIIYEDQNQTQDSAKFKKFVAATQNKSNLIILLSCKVNGQKVVFGGYSCKPFPALGETWQHEFDYQVPYSEGNFVFYYNPEKELHFTMTHNKPFGYIYTDYEEGGALSISGDFFLISWSYEFQNSCGNIYDMKCIEDPSIMTFYSNMEILQSEVWWCNTSQKQTKASGKLKSDLKKSPYYKPNSPFNFFKENLIFEVNKEMSVEQASLEILGQKHNFIDYPSEKALHGNKQLSELQGQTNGEDDIIDLIVLNHQSSQQERALTPPTAKQEAGGKLDDKVEPGNLFKLENLIEPKDADLPSLSEEAQAQQEPLLEKPKMEAEPKSKPTAVLPFIPQQPILKKFEAKGGIYDLITAAKTVVAQYKNDKLRTLWSLWLQEIESFSQLPSYFQTFCLNKEKEVIVYELLEGKLDTDKLATDPEYLKIMIQQEELHIEMVKYSYSIVNKVFEQHEGAELRDLCLKNGTIERFIDRIGQLSNESKRTKIDASNPVSEPEVLSPVVQSEEQGSLLKKEALNESFEKKLRKGVGYTNGVGTAWNVNEYLKSKEAKSAQITNIINILRHFLKSKDWEIPAEVKSLLLESSLLPTLESAFRSGSLLEMAKDFELNMSYLDFVQELANHLSLVDMLMEIGDLYEPLQKEPIYKLLIRLNDLSQIFLGCLTDSQKQDGVVDEQTDKPKRLAQKISASNAIVQEKIQSQTILKQHSSIQDILSMPLEDAYHKLLASLRFDYMSMKQGSSVVYSHSFTSELASNVSPTVTKLVRLAQEIADLSNSLPCEYTNGVFCRVDKERVDLMRCCIMGASDTPYAHGAFIYDLFFENSYPNSPPKCLLVTTGGQTVRFNPNLYHNGKVCLSLLGTWRGFATENWDPKLSTILQVLLSIQAIIMSSEVYFNEPGYEHEAGTPEGERKNEGYANIVRYCNIKFAIIEQIKNPPEGFEKIIKRNFYLKKNVILTEVKKWVDAAKTSDAVYTGLVYDHNYHWAPQISPEGKYAEMMEAIYKELKETLESIPSPFEDDSTGAKIERKFSKMNDDLKEGSAANKEAGVTFEQSTKQLEEIDVSYDQLNSAYLGEQAININDEKVKDRWSRYIGAMGIEAVAKQAESRILIIGLGPLGIEIAKNLVLAGCKELVIYDISIPKLSDLGGGQFFLTLKDTENTIPIDQCCKDKLQQLNFYVKVSLIPDKQDWLTYLSTATDFKVVIITKTLEIGTAGQIYQANRICQEKNFNFIHTSQDGLFGRVFNYFGAEHVVIDSNGEELQEVMIGNITQDKEGGVVTLLQGYKHRFEDGDHIVISEVQESSGLVQNGSISINNSTHTVKTISPTEFRIGDTSIYTQYVSSGLAKQIKVPKKVSFQTLSEYDRELSDKLFDQNLLISDFEKIDNFNFVHLCYEALFDAINNDKSVLIDKLTENYQEFYETILQKHTQKEWSPEQLKKFNHLSLAFMLTLKTSFAPISAYLGGVVAQEAIKAITQKFMPITQFYYYDALELFPTRVDSDEDQNSGQFDNLISKYKESLLDSKETESDKYQSLTRCLGKDLVSNIQQCNLFMIGAGAIGCELLKNYAMLGLGTGPNGGITITDPDVIEVSNLNRQFLFREKHLRKPKSQIAAATSVQMNPDLKGHINARLDKIHEGTSHIYTEKFFKSQTIVTNALDNVQARLYIDKKCVSARVALIDSGTLGPKGHVQIIIPFKSESYASQNDPEDNTQIPHCTLKMFPEEALHCVEWAKDLFGSQYGLNPQSYNKFIFDQDIGHKINFFDQQEIVVLKKVIKIEQKRPLNLDDCITIARQRFQKYFHNDILQLLHVYPVDKQTKDGRLFWALPKRPPVPIIFDQNNVLHATFIQSTACLLATIYKIEIAEQEGLRNDKSRLALAARAAQVDVPLFVPNDQKSTQMEAQVEKELIAKQPANDLQELEQQQEAVQPKHDIETLQEKYNEVIVPLQKIKDDKQRMVVQEFEKDIDSNYHVDFIYSMANVRANNYKLAEMDWLTVKIKAGRIVPALATTTAAVAALQTIEMLKYLKKCKFEDHRNTFLNLAVPSLMMSEPGPAAKTTLKAGLEVTLWDRWEYNDAPKSVTLLEVVKHLEVKQGLKTSDVFYGSTPLFINAIQGRDQESRQKHMDKPLLELIAKDSIEDNFLELTVTFVDDTLANGEKILEGVPTIRVNFIS